MRTQKEKSYNEWLVVNSQLGDRAAFNQLLQEWQGRLLAYAVRRLGSGDAAAEVVQECLEGVVRGIQRLRDPGAFPAWCYRMLERRCVDYLRRALTEKRFLDRDADAERFASGETEDFTCLVEKQLTVEQALAHLEPAIAVTLKLYYQEALSIAEIADILEIPAGTVKSRLFYARRVLAALLEESQ